MMKRDPDNHTKWKRMCGWHNRGNVWDKIATDWPGEEDRMRARNNKNTRTDRHHFVFVVLDNMKMSVDHRKEKEHRLCEKEK